MGQEPSVEQSTVNDDCTAAIIDSECDLRPEKSDTHASTAFCEVPRTLAELLSLKMLSVGSVLSIVGADCCTLRAIKHPLSFRTAGRRVRVLRLSANRTILEDTSPKPNRDRRGR